MSGARLLWTKMGALNLGSLYAYFDAFLDFLINMEPFFFQLQSRIAIGVRFTMDLWIVTIRINAEVSASLQVSGPPFGGVVHVDFWVFGFDVKFGASPSRPEKLSIDKFWEMSSKLPPACILTCESGLEHNSEKNGGSTGNDKKEDDAWLVRGGAFSFQVTFQFAINKGKLKETLLKESRCQKMDFFTDGSVRTDIYAKPMQLRSALTSKVTVSVSQTALPPFQRHHGEQAVRAMGGWKDQKWRIEPIVKPASVSIWGQYDEMSDPGDPKSRGNNVSSLLNDKDSTIPLVMGLSIAPPEPEMSDDKIKSFNVVEDGKQYVFGNEPTPKFPGVTVMSDKAWTPRAASKEESWKDVPEVWKGKGKREKPAFDPTQVVSMWAAKMEFPDGQITGARPSKLLERFENMVPALPMVAVSK
ncbi:hypothetical protein TrVFT333_002309 [Trichoderma virens FT-333]|nr:hypothetical protein TrVFT333_002309 [Trichoderma virens FT-333]